MSRQQRTLNAVDVLVTALQRNIEINGPISREATKRTLREVANCQLGQLRSVGYVVVGKKHLEEQLFNVGSGESDADEAMGMLT